LSHVDRTPGEGRSSTRTTAPAWKRCWGSCAATCSVGPCSWHVQVLAKTDRSWPWSSSESGTQRARALAAGWCVARPRCVSGCRVP